MPLRPYLSPRENAAVEGIQLAFLAYGPYAGKSFCRKNFNFGTLSSPCYEIRSPTKPAANPIYLEAELAGEGEVLDSDVTFCFQNWISSLEGFGSATLRR